MGISRRRCLKTMIALGAATGVQSTWAGQLAARMKAAKTRRRLVVLWMPGGPSQMDTFDLKPGHENGGSFKEISTKVPGIKISEHLPGIAQHMDKLSIVRSMSTKEGDHSRGTYLIRTGQRPGAPVRYPSVPAALAKELSAQGPTTTGYVSILPNSFINPPAFSAGFLGASREPLTVASTNSFNPEQLGQAEPRETELRVDNLLPPDGIDKERLVQRRQFWEILQEGYGVSTRQGAPATHDTVYRRAMQLAESDLVEAFDLTQESDDVRESYGTDPFGQGCLMARRLLQRDVPVVEVSMADAQGGLSWDSHANNFDIVKTLSERLDRSWSRLMTELEETGLLEETTIVWMGEFGRTPRINPQGGRDHFPGAWSCVLGGAGIQGGSVIGKTTADGMAVADNPVTAPDFLATLCEAVGVDPETENMAADRRPIKISEGLPIKELLA
ncbi:MAG TPA: DUF1501 domain-containing protein [Planctomycetaceae bacterium]|nr:DUF1501 domain-containing protein [Planctomycetaceae bacterium]